MGRRSSDQYADANQSRKKDYVLVCGHTVIFRTPPRKGEKLWCLRCDDWIYYSSKPKFSASCIHREWEEYSVGNLYSSVKKHHENNAHEIIITTPNGSRVYVPKAKRKK